MPKCETCLHWQRGESYLIEAYGNIPAKWAWTAHNVQTGECRIVAPWRVGGFFPTTYEFQGCNEHQPKEPGHD